MEEKKKRKSKFTSEEKKLRQRERNRKFMQIKRAKADTVRLTFHHILVRSIGEVAERLETTPRELIEKRLEAYVHLANTELEWFYAAMEDLVAKYNKNNPRKLRKTPEDRQRIYDLQMRKEIEISRNVWEAFDYWVNKLHPVVGANMAHNVGLSSRELLIEILNHEVYQQFAALGRINPYDHL